jgi:hypothetical protein
MCTKSGLYFDRKHGGRGHGVLVVEAGIVVVVAGTVAVEAGGHSG